MSPAVKKVAATPAETPPVDEPVWPFGLRTITKEQSEALRAPFPPEQVGKLPRTTCSDCSDKSKRCTQHERKWCDECGNTISTRHIHLDYVGHAAVTDRLLSVDPQWDWEPVPNSGELGLPTPPGTMWIRLTVCGVTRFGVGDASGKTGPDAVKEMIGDALRNAAMRFGVALDLWMKERNASVGHGSDSASAPRQQAAKRSSGGRAPSSGRSLPGSNGGAKLEMPTGTLPEIRQKLHDRMKALPEPTRAKTFAAFAKAFGDPNDLGAGKVMNAVALIAAAEKSAPTQEKPAEPPPETVRERHARLLAPLVGQLDNDDLDAMFEAEDQSAPAELDDARAAMVKIMAAQLTRDYPDGVTDREVEAWWDGDS